jgi:signal transduction histidine kinase
VEEEGVTLVLDLGALRDTAGDLSGQAAFFDEKKELLFSELPPAMSLELLEAVTQDSMHYEFQEVGAVTYLLVAGTVSQGEASMYLLLATDVSTILVQKNQMLRSFLGIYFGTLLFSMLVILLLSALISKPINKLNRAAAQIAQGNYAGRLSVGQKDEIGSLALSFNTMADSIEEKIWQLEQNARQKEYFVASFAHELKTPLTSVIGYADLLYQKEMNREQVKDSAWYILNEGLRLEALSLKLMDLIVLNKQEFVLEEMEAQDLCSNAVAGLKPMLEEKKLDLTLNLKKAPVMVEYDLFKTLLWNLIDNGIKAGGTRMEIFGKQVEGRYQISVSDNGCGMPPGELERITEAFYMVDKSRSRKQHGAGLGLALAQSIADIHGGELEFESKEGEGTLVRFSLTCVSGEALLVRRS